MHTIALIGPGAIGGTLASLLLENPDNQVTLCVRTPIDCLSITHQSETKSFSPTIATSPDALAPVDWIILATKTYQVPQAAAWLPALTGPETQLAVVQNGVEHLDNLQPSFPPERTLPVIIDCPAERPAPGKFIRHGDVFMSAPNVPAAEAFSQLFNHPAVTIDITCDWTTAAWKKLCINAAGAISALVDQPANVAAKPEAAAIMRSLIAECVAVGRAEGAELDEASIAEQVIASAAAAPPGAMNSLHADLAAKRPMEWQARNGVIARLGQKHGIPTPCNQMAAQLLSLLEQTYTA
ncbi:2-dehydropantoate 2-reductase [Pelagicoccus sp. SDUM812003]|uniref:2-dehydropantoate 2-reductase n=1 Tax=Pelagicoccus sp. SDUM812003 TaxID=3041267 RepID=UPI00280C5D2F|nr:2-dehydropantoate 2-reductase [Pelagicoccus sp. SDUM812003]MDQ8202497.1 2-dehydropantoate 2-reductase [Pelagicoccus sp. SDUM812003]